MDCIVLEFSAATQQTFIVGWGEHEEIKNFKPQFKIYNVVQSIELYFTAEFYLYDDGSINASWTNDINFFFGNYDNEGWAESVQLLIYYDVNTTELILPDYNGDFVSMPMGITIQQMG